MLGSPTKSTRSLNTVLLSLFRALSGANRSFSHGDLAFEVDALSSVVGSDITLLPETQLRTPLNNQCPCQSCQSKSQPNAFLEFVLLTPKYVQVKIKPHASTSLTGVMERISASFGAASRGAGGCHNRSSERRPYSFAAHDVETYGALCKDFNRATEEASAYNAHRTGDEFFVPTELIEGEAFIV